MTNLILPTKVQILFDESGTPTFKNSGEHQIFIGASAIYKENEEKEIFSACADLIGFKKSSPKKFRDISVRAAKEIANTLTGFPIFDRFSNIFTMCLF